MYSDPILEEKWRVQKILFKEANYDIGKLINMSHNSVVALARKMNIKLKYSQRKGDCLQKIIYQMLKEKQKEIIL